MSAIAIIAGKDFRDGLRNRWVAGVTLLLAVLALALAFLGSAPVGTVAASRLAVTVVSLSSLTIFLVPLIALLLSYDAIVGEIDRGTMALLLAYPVSRLQVILGKFLGHVAILAVATLLGYGLAGVAILLASGDFDGGALRAFGLLIVSSVLLGAAFVAIGYLISAAVRDRGTAAAAAVGVWLAFVLVYDVALLGLLVADHGRAFGARALDLLLLFNPADAFRLLNLAGVSSVSALSGMAGLGVQAAPHAPALVLALAAWTALPLGLAATLFRRRQL